MKMHIRHQIVLGLVLALLCVLPQASLAAESTSYQLYGHPADTQGGPLTSTSYQMNVEMATWRGLPGTSTNYRIVFGTQSTSASSSSSISSVASADSDGGGGGVGTESGGGRRGNTRGDQIPASAHSATSSAVSIPHVPVASRPMLPQVPVASTPDGALDDLHFAASPEGATDSSIESLPGASQWKYVEYRQYRVPLVALDMTVCEVGFGVLVILVVAAALAVGSGFMIGRRMRVVAVMKKKKKKGKRAATAVIVALMFASLGIPRFTANAAITAPQRIVYNGHLLDSTGTPVTSAVSVRFSFWNSGDYVAGDITGTGVINTSATTYASWNEAHTITPNSQGYFTVELGSSSALPDFSSYSTETLLSLYLQVEVKASSAADTAYELLDFDSSSSTSDRSPMRSVPFALNADSVDRREVGTGSGDLAILGPGAVFNPARIPGGTSSGAFIIDYDGSESSSVSLQFGKSLGKSLVYDGSAARFNFNDDVRIEGDLTVTGLVNGMNLSTISGTAPLKVSSGAGLNVTINAGSYRINGSITNYAGGSSVSVTNNTTNYVFFGSGGLAVSTIGFPNDESAVRLAEVTTSGGAITAVSDRRVTSSDDRERSIEQYFRPEYANAAYAADGSSNVGQLSVLHDTSTKRNYYAWTSTRTSLQDYDILLKIPLTTDFAGWTDNALRVAYKSGTASAEDNKLDIAVYDTAGNAVTLSGSVSSLVGTSWATTQIEFTGTPTFTAGQDFLVKFTVSSKNSNAMHLGETTLAFRELLQ